MYTYIYTEILAYYDIDNRIRFLKLQMIQYWPISTVIRCLILINSQIRMTSQGHKVSRVTGISSIHAYLTLGNYKSIITLLII